MLNIGEAILEDRSVLKPVMIHPSYLRGPIEYVQVYSEWCLFTHLYYPQCLSIIKQFHLCNHIKLVHLLIQIIDSAQLLLEIYGLFKSIAILWIDSIDLEKEVGPSIDCAEFSISICAGQNLGCTMLGFGIKGQVHRFCGCSALKLPNVNTVFAGCCKVLRVVIDIDWLYLLLMLCLNFLCALRIIKVPKCSLLSFIDTFLCLYFQHFLLCLSLGLWTFRLWD